MTTPESNDRDITDDPITDGGQGDPSSLDERGEDGKPCEVCGEPVQVDDLHEILRASGPVWRHSWHNEPV